MLPNIIIFDNKIKQMNKQEEGFRQSDYKGLFTFYREENGLLGFHKDHSEQKMQRGPTYNSCEQKHQKSATKISKTDRQYPNNITPLPSYQKQGQKSKKASKRQPSKGSFHKINPIQKKRFRSYEEVLTISKNVIDLNFEQIDTKKTKKKIDSIIMRNKHRTQYVNEQIPKKKLSTCKLDPIFQKESIEEARNYYTQPSNTPQLVDFNVPIKFKKDPFPKISLVPLHKVSSSTNPVKRLEDRIFKDEQNCYSEIQEQLPQLIKLQQDKRVNFWQYFQDRKKFFLNRYKKTKVMKKNTQIKNEQIESKHYPYCIMDRSIQLKFPHQIQYLQKLRNIYK